MEWRTTDGVISGLDLLYRYEVDMYRTATNSLRDTLVINWQGYLRDNGQQTSSNLNLYLFVPGNSAYRYLNSLRGQRLQIDAATGYFTTGVGSVNTGNIKGTGNIYFIHAGSIHWVSTCTKAPCRDCLMLILVHSKLQEADLIIL